MYMYEKKIEYPFGVEVDNETGEPTIVEDYSTKLECIVISFYDNKPVTLNDDVNETINTYRDMLKNLGDDHVITDEMALGCQLVNSLYPLFPDRTEGELTEKVSDVVIAIMTHKFVFDDGEEEVTTTVKVLVNGQEVEDWNPQG